MKPSWLKPLVAVGVSLFVSVPAPAQPLFGGAESIECVVANADRVVVGKLVAFGDREQADERGGRAVTIAVEDTLKGEHRERLRLRLFRPVPVLTEWKEQSCRLLLAAQGDPPAETGVVDLSSKDLAVLTADFALLRKPEAVIQSARETVRCLPGVKQIDTFRLVVPGEAVAGTKWRTYYETGGYITLTVPVDERLEKRAHESIRSKSFMQREEGARALRYFKSDENVARVKALLNDPEWVYISRAEDNQGLEVRNYGVREEAYRTLQYWGMKADKPVLREETVKLDRVQTVVLSNTKVTVAELRKLARFQNLRDLFLWNAPVTDEGLKELACFTKLQNLYLGGTKVTDAGLKHLAAITSLQYLDLGSTQVTDAGLRELARFKSLQKLDLSKTQVTASGVAELRKLRPDLTIER